MEGGGSWKRKPACLREEVDVGVVHIKYREMMSLVSAHYSQTDADAPSPTEVSPFFLSCSRLPPHPHTKLLAANKDLNLMHKMESQGMSSNWREVYWKYSSPVLNILFQINIFLIYSVAMPA